jgi:hypothetical protein
MVGIYDVETPPWLGPVDARRVIESLSRLRPDQLSGIQSPVSAAYKELARESASAFRSAVAGCANGSLREPWLTPLLRALAPEETGPGAGSLQQSAGEEEWGRLLWLHPVYVLASGTKARTRQLRRLVQPFTPAYSRTVDFPKGIFVPGIDSSAIAVRGDIAGQEVPIKLTALHWAYYALFMEMDRGLLATLDSDKWQELESLGALEADTDRMFRLYMRVKEARARLDSALTDLGGGQLGLWNTIADVTKFEELVNGVEEKIGVLQRVADNRVQEATAARARKTGKILSALTALTVVTAMVALLSHFFGTKTDAIGHMELRVLVILVAFLLAVVLYREGQRDFLSKSGRHGASSEDL